MLLGKVVHFVLCSKHSSSIGMVDCRKTKPAFTGFSGFAQADFTLIAHDFNRGAQVVFAFQG